MGVPHFDEFTFAQEDFPLAPGIQAKELVLADKSSHYANQDQLRAIEKDASSLNIVTKRMMVSQIPSLLMRVCR